MGKYKAIIFDLDGTAMPNVPNGMPSSKLIETVTTTKSHIKLCAATGRSITNAGSILDALNLDEPCVISGGTQIIDPKTGDILWETVIKAADVTKILEVCQSYPYELLFHTELLGEGAPAADRTADKDANIIYIMGCSQSDSEIILDQLQSLTEVSAAGVTSWTAGNIDIHVTPRDATKEHAIAELLRILNVDKKEAVGVGDADNDIHLFQAVGYKVAMGNATDLLKSQANEICDTVDNDGLAKFIQKLARV